MSNFITALNLYRSYIEKQILSSNSEGDLKELLDDIPNWNDADLSMILSFYEPDVRRKVVRYKLLDSYIAVFPIVKIQRAFRRHLGAYEKSLIRAFKRTFPNAPYLEVKDMTGKVIQSFMEKGHSKNKIICEKRVVNDIRIQGKEIVCFTDNTERKQRQRIVKIGMFQPNEGGAKIFYFSVRIEFSWNEKRGVVIDKRCEPIPNFSITRIQRAFRRHLKAYDIVLTNALTSLFPNSPEAIITQIAGKIIKSFMEKGHSKNQVICAAREVRDLSIDRNTIICVTDNRNRKERDRIVSINVLLPPITGGFKVFRFSVKISFSWNSKNTSVVDGERGLLEVKSGIKEKEIFSEIEGAKTQQSLAEERPDLFCRAPELLIRDGKRTIFETVRYEEFFNAKRRNSYKWLLAGLKNVINGIRFIHARGYIHRDIKPENLFVNRKGNVLIGDFGLRIPQTELCDAAGTAFYVPQRCFHNNIIPIKEQDTFAFIVSLARILFGNNLNNYLADPVVRDAKKYLREIIEKRKLFANQASYDDINNTVYQSLLMDTLRSKLIIYIKKHISDELKKQIIDKIIIQSVEVGHLIEAISSSNMPEEHKKECIIMIKLFEVSFKLLVDAVQGDIKKNTITSKIILEALLSIAS